LSSDKENKLKKDRNDEEEKSVSDVDLALKVLED
jgi:hypothetical protein